MAERDPGEGGPSAGLQRRLAEVEAERDALAARVVSGTAPGAQARRRLETVLARLAPLDRIDAALRPPPSLGQKAGALLDILGYGLADLIGVKREQARARVRLARAELRRGAGEAILRDPVTGETEPVWPPANLLLERATRESLRDIVARLLAASADHGPVTHVIALNFHAGGGAESVALACARVAAEHGGTVAMLMTDPGPRRDLPRLPDNIVVIDFEETGPLDDLGRQALVFLILQAVEPGVLHIVNSDAAWRMLRACPPELLAATRVVASLFALQFDGQGRPEGYAARHLPQGGPRLDALLTDNLRFAMEGPARVGAAVPDSRISVLFTPSRLEGRVSPEDAAHRLARRVQLRDRQTILWAGRLDAEKRIDLLAEIAAAMADRADFHVYGRPVLGAPLEAVGRLEALPNVRLRGAYRDPLEWDADEPPPGVFLFTSVWEGMPNTLIEAAWMGMPIVASAVGGVTDLVDAVTGWPLHPGEPASAYVAALDAIAADRAATLERTGRLIARVHARHTHAAFEAGVREAYGDPAP